MILCDSLRFERQLTASPLQVHYGRSESRSHWHAELIDERVSVPATKGSASEFTNVYARSYIMTRLRFFFNITHM